MGGGREPEGQPGHRPPFLSFFDTMRNDDSEGIASAKDTKHMQFDVKLLNDGTIGMASRSNKEGTVKRYAIFFTRDNPERAQMVAELRRKSRAAHIQRLTEQDRASERENEQ